MKIIKNIIKYDKKIMTMLNIISIIAIITGSLFLIVLNKTDKSLVVNSIKDFFNKLLNSKFNYANSFLNLLFENYLIAVIIWVVGISIVGSIITVILIFYKVFLLGFTIATIIYAYSIKGIIISIIYCFPHLIINVLALSYLGTYSIKLSVILFKSILKKEKLDFKAFINNYVKVLLISVFILSTSIIYEVFISSYILKFICSIIINK